MGDAAIEATVLTDEVLSKVRQLNEVAKQREQSLAQMALAWVLKDERVTSVIIGASKAEQVLDSVQCLRNISFSKDELDQIENILAQ